MTPNLSPANKTPRQQDIQRMVSLHQRVTHLYEISTGVMERALIDATLLQAVETPHTLSVEGLADMVRVQNGLNELKQHYEVVMSQLAAVNEVEVAAVEVAAEPVAAIDALAARRELLERVQAQVALNQKPEDKVGEVKHRSNTTAPVSTGTTAGGLPSVVEPTDVPLQSSVAQLRPPPVQNNLNNLFSDDSPLLDIFAPAPWVPDGRGTITVGSEGFKWYKRVNPMDKEALERARLPTGFYGGGNVPHCVILRLATSIIMWPFQMEPTATYVFMSELSDSDPENVNWFKASLLPASFTRRLVMELRAKLTELRSAKAGKAETA